MEASFQKFPTVFVSLKGRNNAVRECVALVDPASEYCVVPKVDAYALGYPEAANDDPITPQDNTVTFASSDGYGKAALIEIAEVALGGMSFQKVDFLAFDLPQVTHFDVIIGRSLLKSTRLEIDYPAGRLRIGGAGS
jgi:predicted aspartyl protease